VKALEERRTIPWPVSKEQRDQVRERLGADAVREKIQEVEQRPPVESQGRPQERNRQR
jgi:hypothetical protein